MHLITCHTEFAGFWSQSHPLTTTSGWQAEGGIRPQGASRTLKRGRGTFFKDEPPSNSFITLV